MPYSHQTIEEANSFFQNHFIIKHILSSPCNPTLSDKYPVQLPCKNDASQCYNFSHFCIYRLDKTFNLLPCKMGSHIQQCEYFECNVHFKCPGYYCIPWGYVCDGKWDCPDGNDETGTHRCGVERICVDMFKCKDSQLCLHLEDVCNGYSECPQGDDELFCELKGEHCLIGCTCYLYAIMCTKIEINYHKLYQLPYVCYHLTLLNILVMLVLKGSQAMIVNLRHNYIRQICNIKQKLLTFLDLSDNVIIKLTMYCFSDLSHFRKVIIANNSISTIQQNSFNSLKNLFSVDISNNNLNTLPPRIFTNVTHLLLLVLYGNPLKQIQVNMFIGTFINFVHSINFQICCVSNSHLICTKPDLWYDSCSNLLPNDSLVTSFIISALLILIVNFVSLHFHIQKSGCLGKPYLIIVIALILTNLLLLFQFIVLWSTNLYYKETFVTEVYHWRDSLMCTLIMSGFLLYKLFQPFILTVLSAARFMVILYPLESKFRYSMFTLKVTIVGFITCVVTSMKCGLIIRLQGSPNNLCLPLVDPSDKSWIVYMITGIIAIVQLVVIVLTTIPHVLIILQIKMSQNNIRFTSNVQSAAAIVKHVILLTMSMVLCWVPASIIFCSALFMNKYPMLMVYWTTVLIVPINAIVIPIVLTLNVQKK